MRFSLFLLGAGLGLGFVRWRRARLSARKTDGGSRRPRGAHVTDLVRSSCARTAEKLSDLVSILPAGVQAVASSAMLSKIPLWDEYEWHCSVEGYGEKITARYVFVLDALNYCFWPSTDKTGLEYEHLAKGLRQACDRGEQFLDLENCTMDRLSGWLERPHEFPLIDTRLAAIRALGRAFRTYGDAIEWLVQADHSAVRLVDLVVERLESFRDEVEFQGETIYFYKRAQILVADLAAAFTTSKEHRLHSIEALTMFADYRVPQVLREMNVLVYNPEIAKIVDSKTEIPRGSAAEIAIRAATVHAVELIKKAMNNRLSSVEVDWILWQTGEATKDEIRPHHRTITTCY